MERLQAAGYRCLAPDQRGYSPGARPEGVESYRLPQLVSDIAAIADAWGAPRFHLVGHDWGAGVGWAFVAAHPGRVLSWTALSVPHPAAFGAAIRDDPDQQQRSQYIGVFQQPGVAEAMLSANDFGPLKAIWNESSPGEVAEYVAVLSQPGALTAALNWYRGVRRRSRSHVRARDHANAHDLGQPGSRHRAQRRRSRRRAGDGPVSLRRAGRRSLARAAGDRARHRRDHRRISRTTPAA